MLSINDELKKIDTAEMQSDMNESNNDFHNREWDTYFALSSVIKPVSVLEVGVYKGQSACAIILGSQPEIKFYRGIDGQKYLKNSNELAQKHIEMFCKLNNIELDWNVSCVNTQIEEEVQNFLKYQANFDWIHIDAGHTTEEAIKDIVQFWTRANRIMTVHDYTSHPEVKEAVDRIVRDKLIDFKSSFLVHSGHGFFNFVR